MSKKVRLLLPNIIAGLICSVVWTAVGIVLYLSAIARLSGYSSVILFLSILWGIPALAAAYGIFFAKQPEVKILLPSLLVGTIVFTLIIDHY
ncbi:hypothetical protein DNH61_16360 [Paenibacillus sambharensis]|uniref:Uncharacterized protein n=1 Tax=Paenibacillus sambharensis TaxID=1803190 RepID=A0A2W1LID1_9BACL|nr:hypothetical protein [Paenibacillus sambharensis]PZD94802.1 hypothetical protein DNH61_16360 [Paenibacillus sambharensis]